MSTANGAPIESGASRESCAFLSAPMFLNRRIRVLVLDLWCYIPYYDRYICEALSNVNVEPRLAAASYYLDPEYFRKHGFRNRPGLLDVVAKLRLPSQTVRRSLMLAECFLNMLALTAWIVFEKPDILHVQWIPLVQKFPFDLWFIKFARKRGVRTVYTVHNVLPHDSGPKFKEVYRRVYAEVDALICHTREAEEQLKSEFSVHPRRIWVIPHGPLFHDAVPPAGEMARVRLGFSEDVCVVLMQGMLKPYKGVGFLLEAWRGVHALGLNAQLVIAGSGEKQFEEEIRAQVISLRLQNSIRLDQRFIPDEELNLYYQASDIIVYPYKAITASGALMTGLSYERAVIATDLPSFREILEDGKSALFVKYGAVETLTAALIRLIRDPKERARLAAEAGTIGRMKLSWPAIAAQTRRCYLAVLGREKGTQ